MISRFAKTAIVLGLVSAIGPFAIDMYLPALPSIAADLGASATATQMTLVAFFLAFGLSQLVYGPWSDGAGRKTPLVIGIGLFIVGAIGCGLATSIGGLIAWRVIQGVGAAAGMVVPRAIIRDLHTGHEATRLMSLVMLVFSVSPIVAPLVGSGLTVLFGWRAVFAAVTIAALSGLVLIGTVLPETHATGDRRVARLGSMAQSVRHLLGDGRFLGLTFVGALGWASLFVFLANSSFLYIGHFGLTPTEFGMAFAINAVGFIGGSQGAAYLGRQLGLDRAVVVAAGLYGGSAILLFGIVALGLATLPVLIGLLFLTFTCLGLLLPTSMVLSLEEHGPIAGMASALGGTLQMVTGGLVIVIASLVFDGTARPMAALIVLCALGALGLSLKTLAGRAWARDPVGLHRFVGPREAP